MKKLLLVFALVAMFSLAASAKKTPTTTYNFQFLSISGDPFCDGMVLKNYGNPQTLVDGVHSDIFCFVELGIGTFNLAVNGFLAPVDPSFQYGGSGNVMIVADESVSFENCFTNFPLNSTGSNVQNCPTNFSYPIDLYLINPATNTWTLWLAGGGAGEYVINYGTLQPVIGPLAKASRAKRSRSSSAR